MKKVIIVGAGISGMTAGIILQNSGFQTEIYEKNAVPGGELTGWKRDGVYIDNCIDYLMCSKKGSAMNELWHEIGMLEEGLPMYSKDYFFKYEGHGGQITFWRDKERTKKEMLELSPEDKDVIEKFFENVVRAESMIMPIDKPMDKMGPRDFMKLGDFVKNVPAAQKAYKGVSVKDLADSFKSPVLRSAVQLMHPEDTQAYSFIMSYAMVTSGSGDIPEGGSLAAARRIAKRYEDKGGKIHLNSPVKNVKINGKIAEGIVLEDGTEVTADYVICASDANHTFTKLLPSNLMPKKLKAEFDNKDHFSVFSKYHAAFLVDGKTDLPKDTSFWECDGINVWGDRVINDVGVICYDYDPTFAPEDKTVLQMKLFQYTDEVDKWFAIADDEEKYEAKKAEIADAMVKIIEKHCPGTEGKIKVLDTWTPVTYAKRFNAYRGAYMAFVADKDTKTVTTPGVVKPLKNVFLAGQWLMGSGGLPPATAQGKYAAWRICKKEGVECK
ncbi:MAG: NAD(P)/FAD-dependent oxidoreductase [Clostridiales bacterium]|nr:NAD(P)/FAD-dependent oxidoreductase [Clostridiales bacterium]